MFVKLRFSLQDPHRSCHFINSVSSFGIGGCYVYLFSPVLVTLHSAEPRGQVAPQMCSPVLSSHWAVTFLDVPRCLGVTGLLSGESSAQRQAVRSATSLTGEQWSLDPGFCGSPPPPPLPLLPNNTSTSPAAPPSIFTAALSLSYSPPWASSAAQPHCHSAGDGWPGKLGRGQRLHNGYSISYQERPAARLEAILLCPWTQTPERHAHTRKVWKQQGKTKWRKKKGSREGTQKTKKNGFLLQQSPQLLLSVAPRNYHIIKLFNKMENIISVLQHAAWLIWTCSKKTDCFDHKPKKNNPLGLEVWCDEQCGAGHPCSLWPSPAAPWWWSHADCWELLASLQLMSHDSLWSTTPAHYPASPLRRQHAVGNHLGVTLGILSNCLHKL